MVKIIKKALKIFLRIVLLVILLQCLLFGVLQFSAVQTFVAKEITNNIAKDLNTSVSLRKVNIDFFYKLRLEDFYLEDLKEDTLIYIKTIELGFEEVNWQENQMHLNITLNQPRFYTITDTNGMHNADYLYDYFSEEEDEDSTAWQFNISSLIVQNGRYRYADLNESPIENEIDFSHLALSGIYLEINNFQEGEEMLSFNLESLRLKDKSGFSLKNMKSNITIEEEIITLNKLEINTAHTSIMTDLQFTADSYDAYENFNTDVYISTDFRNSSINTNDLAFFASDLAEIDEQIFINGKIKGTINNLKAKGLEVYVDQDTYLSGNFDMRGLPDFENTFMHFDIKELNTNADALSQTANGKFKLNEKLPDYLYQLGGIAFQGNFTGYVDDFVAYGDLNTDLGKLTTDLYLSKDSNDLFVYQGNLASSLFNLGEFLVIEELGNINFDWEVDGSGFKSSNAEAHAKGSVKFIEFRDYNYKDIQINAELTKGLFNGEFGIDDPNLKFDFKGNIDLRPKEAIANYAIQLEMAKLAKLNLYNEIDSTTSLSLEANINMQGFELDNFIGDVEIHKIHYTDKDLDHNIQNIEVHANKVESGRQIKLYSDLMDASVLGEFHLNKLGLSLSDLFLRHTESEKRLKVANQKFEFDLHFKAINELTEILHEDIQIDSLTYINGNYDAEGVSNIHLHGESLSYGDIQLQDYQLSVTNTLMDSLYLSLESKDFRLNSFLDFGAFQLNSFLYEGNNLTNINWKQSEENTNSGELHLEGEFMDINNMNFHFEKSRFTIEDTLWTIASENKIHLDSNIFQMYDLSIGNEKQSLLFNGAISKSKEDTLIVDLNNIDLTYVSNMLGKEVIQLKGVVDGHAEISNVYQEPALISNLDFSNLFVNDIDIGEAHFISSWMDESKALYVDANLGKAGDQLLEVKGKYFPFRKNNLLFNLSLNDLPLTILDKYVEEYISQMEGTIDGELSIQGSTEKPMMYGNYSLNQSKFKVNYLNTNFSIDDEFVILPDFIGFNAIEVKDAKGNSATLTGTIFHENYADFNFDLGLDMNNFYMLNTTAQDNELFYGQAYLSGLGNISGYGDQLYLELQVETDKGSSFNIPMERDVEVSASDFLVFTNSPNYKKEEKVETDLSGIQMSFDLNIKEEAETRIIFDEQLGDVLYTKGSGLLKLGISPLGDFSILGEYTVESGNYLFTLQNIVNKRFQLAKGSKIYWDGDPYRARLDITAVYETRAALKDLFPEDSSAAYRRRIPVDLKLNLSEYLLNPEINFDIDLRTSDDETKRRLQSILYVNNNEVNRQEMNQQVFGLLVFNRFMTPSNSSGAGGFNGRSAGANNGYEFLSNQLSNWLSNLSEDFDVGLRYRPADEVSSEELDLSLSTELLNDRLTIDGSLGYTGRSDINPNQNSAFIGEFSAEYKLSQDGRFRIRGFNRSTKNSLLQTNSPYTQGIGLFYREEFDTFNELWRKYFGQTRKD